MGTTAYNLTKNRVFERQKSTALLLPKLLQKNTRTKSIVNKGLGLPRFNPLSKANWCFSVSLLHTDPVDPFICFPARSLARLC